MNDPAKWLSGLGMFIFIYPVVMSMVWVVGGLLFWKHKEQNDTYDKSKKKMPPVTILVPCHNEEICIADTCESLMQIDYYDCRIVLIDDASTDQTAAIIHNYLEKASNFHLLRLSENQGKARALNYALFYAVTTPITLVIDADTILTPRAVTAMVLPFLSQPRMGAVTGNPLAVNRSNLLEKLQTAEFASIIGLIKRSQRSLGRILTVSGCVAAYRTGLLKEIGGFSMYTATEDIDMTWQIQKRFQEVWYSHEALAFINVPSNLKEYWKQRTRWALGGWHLLKTHRDIFSNWKWRRLWPIYIEQVISNFWSFSFVIVSFIWILTTLLPGNSLGYSVIPAWYGGIISLACMAQFGAALFVNHRFDSSLWKIFFWVPWYPIFYFCFSAFAVVYTSYKGLFGKLEDVGKWTSPKRENRNPAA